MTLTIRNFFLQVSDGLGTSGGVSHESSTLSSAPLVLTNNSRHKAVNAKVEIDDHVSKNHLQSITLNSGSIYYSNFHKFISWLPSSILRVKGFVSFINDNNKWLYHWAGRKRHDLTRESWQHNDVKSCHLVVIGSELDTTSISSAWSKLNQEPVFSSTALDYWKKLFEDNLQLDLFDTSISHRNLDKTLLYFRATGARFYQFSFADLKLRGIDINAINVQIAAAVNKLGQDNLVLLVSNLIEAPLMEYFEPDSIWLAVSLDIEDGNEDKIKSRYQAIVSETERILDFTFKHVHHCRCPI